MTVHAPLRALPGRFDSPAAPAAEPTDTIFIRELKLETHIGAYEDERQRPQTLEFNLEIGVARNRACLTDRLGDTIDYAQVVTEIRTLLALHRFHLLEALAESVAQQVLREFGAQWIALSIAKQGIVPGATFVGVSLIRDRRALADRAAFDSSIRCSRPEAAAAAPTRN